MCLARREKAAGAAGVAFGGGVVLHARIGPVLERSRVTGMRRESVWEFVCVADSKLRTPRCGAVT